MGLMLYEGYTPAALALGIILTANKRSNLLLLLSLVFYTPPFYTVLHVFCDSFFFFETPPPLLNCVCWASRLG